jgi:short-subunit dehydrogenase
VSTSVVCPSFVDQAGMFADLKNTHALRAPPILGTCTPQAVADAVLRVIERDEPELFVGARPLRVMFSGAVMFPRLLEWLSLKLGVNTMFLQAAQKQSKKD